MSHLVAPSILTADFLDLKSAVELINNSEADWIHCDVMDGVFVPNISFGFPVIQAIKKISRKPLDVHIMIVQPDKYIERFKEYGADILTVHYEACTHLNKTVNKIKSLGIKAGVTLNPHTPVAVLEEIIKDVDMVLIMSVNPGFGGQSFIQGSIEKIQKLKELILSKNSKATIEVDGGIDMENARTILNAGADILVVGNTIFSSNNPKEVIRELKSI